MISIIRERLRQGQRTIAYPAGAPTLPDRFRGLPVLDDSKCPDGCRACVDACPTDAIANDGGAPARPGPVPVLHRLRGGLSAKGRSAFTRTTGWPRGHARGPGRAEPDTSSRSPQPLDEKMRQLFGRSLKLRQVSAGGDNASEADLNVLGTVVFDMGRFGIQFVASPRHADGIVVTGPVSENMKLALLETYEAVPAPKLVIAVGAAAISGGIFRGHPEVHDGVEGILPIDLYIPGDPPHPLTILDGLLRLLGRIDGPPQR